MNTFSQGADGPAPTSYIGPMAQTEDPFQGTAASLERLAKSAAMVASERDQLRNQLFELRERVAQLEQAIHGMVANR